MALDRRFKAEAKPFSEYVLSASGGELFRLQYVHNPSTESVGGVCYRCEYISQEWELRFFSIPYLKRESYQLFCTEL